ncbi:MAG: ACT domain-containing protein [Parasporobacterium sp.]|nr:ACT domain-containing protein [Parasporobacterium sp.]
MVMKLKKLDFSLIGILSKISTILAENQIGIFAYSPHVSNFGYCSDKILIVKALHQQRIISALNQIGGQ